MMKVISETRRFAQIKIYTFVLLVNVRSLQHETYSTQISLPVSFNEQYNHYLGETPDSGLGR